jgi:hypothetical protein
MSSSPAEPIAGRVYAARSMIVGEEDLLKIGYSENVGRRFPDGDFRILFDRPDTRIHEAERYRRHIAAMRGDPKAPEFVAGLRIGFEIGGRWRDNRYDGGPHSNGRTELVRFDLEATGIIRANLHKAGPDVRGFLEVALRFAGSQPKEANRILCMVYGLPDPTTGRRRPEAVLAPDPLPPADAPWDGRDEVPDIDNPPVEIPERPGRPNVLSFVDEGYRDPDDDLDEDPDEAPTGPGSIDEDSDEEEERLYGNGVRRY